MQKLRKLIRETIGVKMSVDKLANIVLDDVYREVFGNGDIEGFLTRVVITDINDQDIINATNIQSVETRVKYTNTEEPSFGGRFSTGNLNPEIDGNFNINILLTINTNDPDSARNNILSVISHELNHAFTFIKQYNKFSRTKGYNGIRGFVGMSLGDIKNVPEIKEFMDMFYLNLPQEIQARVQETGAIIKTLTATTFNDAVQELYRNPPINDARAMVQYKTDKIKRLSPEILNKFVESFNNSVNYYEEKHNTELKRIGDINTFFNYWQKFINDNGEKLNRKILKLVANKFRINEDYALFEAHSYGLIEYIFGDGYFFIH